ncbi:hypothetical protein FI667_g4785, partial [Globisporangium splendens]
MIASALPVDTPLQGLWWIHPDLSQEKWQAQVPCVPFPILPQVAQLSQSLVPATALLSMATAKRAPALLPMASAKRETALITASVVGGAARASFLLRAVTKSIVKTRAATLIKGMLVDANIIVGRDTTVHDNSMFFDWTTRGMLGIGESYMAKEWDAIIPLDEVLACLQTQRYGTVRQAGKRIDRRQWRVCHLRLDIHANGKSTASFR